MTRAKKITMAAVAVLFVVVVAGILANAELRTFLLIKVAPGRARDSLLIRLKKPSGPEIYLLGTIHGDHLETEAYSLAHIEAVLLHLRPARLLVESRPDQIAAGNLADGPIEMAYASLIARAEGIDFDGMDWWDEEGDSVRRTDATRDDRMVRNIVERTAGDGTTLVLAGFSHVPEFAQRLRELGYEELDIPPAARAALFDPAGVSELFPAGMGEVVERRIATDEATLREGRKPGRAERIRSAVTARRDLLARIAAVGERAPGVGGPPVIP